MFFVTMFLIRSITGFTAYSNYMCIYAIYGTKMAIKLIFYFETYYILSTLLSSWLNYIFEDKGDITNIIIIFSTLEVLCLGYSIFFL